MSVNLPKIVGGVLSVSAIVLSANLAVTQTTPTIRQITQNINVKTVGKVDPSQTIDVIITNNTSATLAAGFSGGSKVKIDPKDKTTVSFTDVPVNLFIYSFGENVNTKYNTKISGNTITVEVVAIDRTTVGDNSLNVYRSGAVYIY